MPYEEIDRLETLTSLTMTGLHLQLYKPYLFDFIHSYTKLLVTSFISYLSYKLHCCTLLDKCCLSHDMCLYQVMMMLHFLNDVANDAESTQKSKITS